jgi:hypothetical protein
VAHLTSKNKHVFSTWFIDVDGNVAISRIGLAMLGRIKNLAVPDFLGTEEAMEWGSHLNAEEHETLIEIQRTSSNAALSEGTLQGKIDHATESQLIREAAEAFAPRATDAEDLLMPALTAAPESNRPPRG